MRRRRTRGDDSGVGVHRRRHLDRHLGVRLAVVVGDRLAGGGGSQGRRRAGGGRGNSRETERGSQRGATGSGSAQGQVHENVVGVLMNLPCEPKG